MGVTDNLAPLFDTGPPGLRFRQGTILTWDPETGHNTVDVGGSVLTDVPIQNTGEAISLKAGHVVNLNGQGNTWWIVGRITPPGDPNFASASVAFGGAGVSATNYSVTTTHSVKASTSITVPSWVDEVVMLATANATIANTFAGAFYVTMQLFCDGHDGGGNLGGGGAQFGVGPTGGGGGSANDLNSAACSAQRIITNPGATLDLTLQIWNTGGTIPANPATLAHIDAIAIFRSTV
jgi:hypothetical protein